MPDSANPSRRPLDSLCVYGIGLAAEMFDQTSIWGKIKSSQGRSILPASPSAYSSDAALREYERENRSASTLAAAIQDFVQHWQIPSLSIWPSCERPSEKLAGDTAYFSERIANLKKDAGLDSHQIASLGAFCVDNPEEVLERTFQFMDGYPDVPAILLYVSDGDITRSLTGDTSRAQYWGDGPRRFGSMCETTVALLLARPERVEPMRLLAINPGAAANTQGAFKPGKYLPTPWAVEQLKQFYTIAPLAELHRPIRISYRKDKDGKQTMDKAAQAGTMHAREKEDAAKAGLAASLNALSGVPGAEIKRAFYDTGGSENGGNLIPLSLAIGDALPDLDLFNPQQAYDINARIGNTGAASPFVQLALAVLATAESKDVSLTACLRQKDEMTITLVSPAKVIQRASNPTRKTEAAPAAPVTSAAPQVKIGTRAPSGTECPQSGMWKCDRADAEGGVTHFIPSGRTLPRVVVSSELSSWQKLRGESGREQVSTVWTLISYDMAIG
jgi:hypothetical protein